MTFSFMVSQKRDECDVREYEQRSGKTLDEDVKVGVMKALAPPQVQNLELTHPEELRAGQDDAV